MAKSGTIASKVLCFGVKMNRSPSILITGCSSGIGLDAAKTLQQRGYQVIATARKDADLKMLEQSGLTAVYLELADPQSIRSCAAQSLELCSGRLDAVFHNAAYGQPGAVEDLRRDVLRQQFEANLFGTMELNNYLLANFRQQGHGRMIFNSSLLGYVALAYRGAYIGSKFALQGMADTLRIELARTALHVCVISPGPIVSKFRANAYRKFLENIDREHSAHAAIYKGVQTRLENITKEPPFTLGPAAVTKKLLHALESNKPKANYYVTFPAYLFAYFRRFLPTSWLDSILIKASN